MSAIHNEHHLNLIHAEVPIIQTGYENEFGENSSSFVRAESDYDVIYKIKKIMETTVKTYVPLVAEISVSKTNWAEKKGE